jgi:transposase
MTKPNKHCQNKDWLYDQYITQGKSTNQIAKEIGCGASAVQHWLRTHEIPIRDCSSSKLKPSSQLLSDESWLNQYITLMKSASKIGQEIGCQQETVSNYLHKYGIPIRSQSEEISGERHPLYGKHHSEETRKKLSETNSKQVVSFETRKKISESLSGKNNPRYGVKLSQDQIERQRNSLLEFYKNNPEKLESSRNNLILNRTTRSGQENNFWKGGISFEPYCPKFNNDLKERVRSYFNYECVICGKTTEDNGRALAVHHVEYDKTACCHGKPVQFAALCHRCHSKTNHNRENWEAILHRIISEIYNNRSYYTQEEHLKIKKK